MAATSPARSGPTSIGEGLPIEIPGMGWGGAGDGWTVGVDDRGDPVGDAVGLV
jgi:hypothetical protein